MRKTATAVTALAILLVPVLVRAQEPVKAFDQLNTRLRVGDKVLVTDARGEEHKGKILELSTSALALDSGRVRTLSASEVRVIQEWQRDSLKNGALIGLATGAGLALTGIVWICHYEECEWNASAAVAVGVYAGIGAAIGTGIDALIPGRKRVVYRAGEASARVSLTPVITPNRKAVALSFSF